MDDEMNLPPLVNASGVDWKIFGIMMVAALFASLAIVPYLIEILRATGKEVIVWEVAASSLMEHMFLMAVAVCIGLLLCPKVNLGTPLLTGWLSGKAGDKRRGGSPLVAALITGIGVAVSLTIAAPWLEALMPEWPDSARQADEAAEKMAAWKPLLASFSAGVTEEIVFRYGLMTLFVWLAAKIARRDPPGTYIFWLANLLAALLFSLAHLTNVVGLGITITPGMVLYVVICNGLASMVLGWLYWRRGLEAAVLAHTTADVLLKVVIPLLNRSIE